MPQVHTYIRNEDLEKWRALENKSAFIHNALNGISTDGKVSTEPRVVNLAEETDGYEGLFYVEGQGVFDEDGQKQEVTAEDIKELKRRGRVR